MNKRLIIGIIVILLAAVIGFLAFAVSKQKKAPVLVAAPQIKQVLDEPVISPVASFDGNAIWYFNSSNRLFRRSIDGSKLEEFPLPALTTGSIKHVLWPKSGSDFIVITGVGQLAAKSYYNNTSNIYTNLPKNIQYLDWLPDSKRIVYIWQSDDNKSQQLVMADADGSGFVPIANVFWPDLNLKASPGGKTVLMWRTDVQDVNKIYSVDLSSGEITIMVGEGKNLGAIWTSPTQFIFAQAAITTYPKLYLFDTTTKKAVDLGLSTSLDKITVSADGKMLYAAIPKKDNTGDTFVTEDLSSFEQQTYLTPIENMKATGLLLAGTSLYFTNIFDQKFYTISK